jgi:AraC-like DNA-binding protein
MMGYWEERPVDALRPYVAALWIWEGAAPPASYRVLPDGCIDIIFSSTGAENTDAHRLDVVGTMTRCLVVSRVGVSIVVGARFRPGGAVTFLDCPASEITDASLSLEELWGQDANRLLSRLGECVSISEKLGVFQQALLERIRGAFPEDERMMYAARRIVADSSCTNLNNLASDAGLSPRQFRRRFEAEVGVGPKRFGRVIRSQRCLQMVLQRGGRWADLAYEHGYCDQAHLIRDFKEFTGLSPIQYMATR